MAREFRMKQSINRGDMNSTESDGEMRFAEQFGMSATEEQRDQIIRLGGKVRDGLTYQDARQYISALHGRAYRATR